MTDKKFSETKEGKETVNKIMMENNIHDNDRRGIEFYVNFCSEAGQEKVLSEVEKIIKEHEKCDCSTEQEGHLWKSFLKKIQALKKEVVR